MGQRGINAGRIIMDLAIGVILALLLPFIVSFIIYIVAAAIPANYLPGIIYGIFQYTSSNAPAGLNIPAGVSYLWIVTTTNAAGNTVISSSSPAFPTVLVNVLNSVMIFIALLVAVIIGIKFVPELLNYIGEQ